MCTVPLLLAVVEPVELWMLLLLVWTREVNLLQSLKTWQLAAVLWQKDCLYVASCTPYLFKVVLLEVIL
jgi:hypothetical protein